MSQDAASTNLARLRAEIEATRRSLAETADALAARVAESESEPEALAPAQPVAAAEPAAATSPEPAAATSPEPLPELSDDTSAVLAAEPEILPAATPAPPRVAIVPAPANLPVVYRPPARRRSVAVAGAVLAVAAMLVRRRLGR